MLSASRGSPYTNLSDSFNTRMDNISDGIKNLDNNVVKLTGTQTIQGQKRFSNLVRINNAFKILNRNTSIDAPDALDKSQAGYIEATNDTSGSHIKLRIMGTRGAGGILFGVNSNHDAMFLNASGNFGIATTNPLERLHVNGNIRSDLLSANEVLFSNSNKNIISSGVPSNYITGLTSNVQTQLDNINNRMQCGVYVVPTDVTTDQNVHITFNQQFNTTPCIVLTVAKNIDSTLEAFILRGTENEQGFTIRLSNVEDPQGASRYINWIATV